MPNADSRCATSTPMRPRPTTPTIFSYSSTPVYLRALPLAALERRVGRGDVARAGEQQADRELGGADDVGRRGVDDHDAGRRRRRDVDVVEADAGAGDDLEPAGRGQRLGVDLGRAADQDRVDFGQRGQQRGAVGAVAAPDLEVGPERLDGGGRSSSAIRTTGLRHRQTCSFGSRSTGAGRPRLRSMRPRRAARADGELAVRPRSSTSGTIRTASGCRSRDRQASSS